MSVSSNNVRISVTRRPEPTTPMHCEPYEVDFAHCLPLLVVAALAFGPASSQRVNELTATTPTSTAANTASRRRRARLFASAIRGSNWRGSCGTESDMTLFSLQPSARSSAASDPDAGSPGAHRCGCARDRPRESVVRRRGGEGDDKPSHPEAGEREDSDAGSAPPREQRIGADSPPFVERPARQLATEEKEHGDERRARVDPVPRHGDRGDVRPARDEERQAEAAAAEHERSHEQQRPERRTRCERARVRAGVDKRVGEDSAVRSRRSQRGCYTGRAKCLNEFTSSRGTASGSPSRHVTTGTPTCS